MATVNYSCCQRLPRRGVIVFLYDAGADYVKLMTVIIAEQSPLLFSTYLLFPDNSQNIEAFRNSCKLSPEILVRLSNEGSGQ